MSLETWLAFAAASAVLLVIPGPTILTVVSYSLAHGRRANVPLVAAVTLGDSTALVLSLLGLGALLATSAFLFNLIKWAGGLYLIILGLRMLRSGASNTTLAQPAAPASTCRLFFNTYAVTATNPKGIIFFIAFLPQFLRPEADIGTQLWNSPSPSWYWRRSTRRFTPPSPLRRAGCSRHPRRGAGSTLPAGAC